MRANRMEILQMRAKDIRAGDMLYVSGKWKAVSQVERDPHRGLRIMHGMSNWTAMAPNVPVRVRRYVTTVDYDKPSIVHRSES